MSPNKHIIMFPFMARGHFNPFLALAKLVSQRHPSYKITILNTPLNIKHLQTLLLPNSNIHLKSLPFDGSDHGLPPSSENTSSLPVSDISTLLHATESLQPQLQQAIEELTEHYKQPPLCIIADVFLGWTVEIARKLGIFHATFLTSGAYGAAIYINIWLHLPHVRNESSEFNISIFPETLRLHRSQLSQVLLHADGTDPCSAFFRPQFSHIVRSNAIICNTLDELEPVGIELLKKSFGLRQWTFGPLLSDDHTTRKPVLEVDHFLKWLDSHPNGSVVYVSFGSENSISGPLMLELASGLQASGKAFIWVVRPPVEFNPNEDFRHEWLPKGFEELMTERMQGLITRKWAPQVEILSHKAIGVFLSHCGWNSVLESLRAGVPMIGWPLAAEQMFNSKMLVEELGVSVEVARGVRDVNLSSCEIERVIRLVMGDGEKAKELKAKAVCCARILKDAMREEGNARGSSIRNLDEFIDTISNWDVSKLA